MRHRGTPPAVLLAAASALILPRSVAYASGAIDLRCLEAAVYLAIGGMILTGGYLVFLVASPSYKISSAARIALFTSTSLLCHVLAQAFNNFLWDRCYQGYYFVHVALAGLVVFPAAYVLVLPRFRPDAIARDLWKWNLAILTSLVGVTLIWFLSEVL